VSSNAIRLTHSGTAKPKGCPSCGRKGDVNIELLHEDGDTSRIRCLTCNRVYNVARSARSTCIPEGSNSLPLGLAQAVAFNTEPVKLAGKCYETQPVCEGLCCAFCKGDCTSYSTLVLPATNKQDASRLETWLRMEGIPALRYGSSVLTTACWTCHMVVPQTALVLNRTGYVTPQLFKQAYGVRCVESSRIAKDNNRPAKQFASA
jgi:hypothetical protein